MAYGTVLLTVRISSLMQPVPTNDTAMTAATIISTQYELYLVPLHHHIVHQRKKPALEIREMNSRVPADLVNNNEAFMNTSSLGTLKMNTSSLGTLKLPALEVATALGYPSAAEMDDSSGLTQIREALQLIPDKADYLEAQRRVPFLVATESPPIRFLQRENFDPWAAAKRLVTYWKERKVLFGERAFLPMDQTGKGALSDEDLKVLNTKFLVILPPDQSNRTILYYDRLRMADETLYSVESRLRTIFYWMQVASENPVSQSEGIISMNIVHGKLNRGNLAAIISIMKHAMPMRLYSVHLVCQPQRRSGVEQIIPTLIQLMGTYVFWKSTTIHMANTKEELLDKLQKHELSRHSVPSVFGGSWTYDEIYEQWKPQRIRIEDERHDRFLEQSLEMKLPPSPKVAPSGQPLQETEGMRERALAELEAALELLPDESKAALLEARQRMPNTVNKEAHPIRFLRFENYNTWAAAQRLAGYWTVRKMVFCERAFLPMNQTGEGTLNSDDVALLNTGFIAFLPDDTNGHSVLCLDGSRRPNCTDATRSRVAFYAASLACENDMTQREGCVVLSALNTPKLDQTIKKNVAFVYEVFPFKVHSHHIGHCPTVHRPGENIAYLQKYFLNTLVPLALRLVGKFAGKRTIVHAVDSTEELRQELEMYGLVKKNLPECMGGTWSYSQFPQWQDVRIRYEWDLPAGTGNKDSGITYKYTVEQYCNLSEKDKVERRRKMNILNSRRKRERRKIESVVLHEQVEELQGRNGILATQNRHLEELLAQANAKVAEIEKVGPQVEKRTASDTAFSVQGISAKVRRMR
jgi:hypothetical protein